jgi:N-formylglutamate amidohydrolase
MPRELLDVFLHARHCTQTDAQVIDLFSSKELSMFMRLFVAVAVAPFCFVALVHSSAYAAEQTPAGLVLVRTGTLPIVLTAPHGGREAIPGLAPRNVEGKHKGGAWNGYVLGGDPNTDTLALGIAKEIKALTGQEPYVIVAKFERKFVDANRPPAMAYDSAGAIPYYDYYHGAVRHAVDEIRKNFSAGLLVDVHGQNDVPSVIMRGTENGRTIKHLLQCAGAQAVTGPNGLFGQLEANGFKISPANALPIGRTSENGGLNGGYTVAVYGSHTANGIDAVQMEFGSEYRQKAVLDQSAKEAAKAIVVFYEAYLKKPHC